VPAYLLLLSLFLNIMVLGCTKTTVDPPWVELVHRIPFSTVTVDSHDIAYLDEGKGFPLVFLHGFGGSMWNWEYQQGVFSDNYRVIIPDLLGSGLSAKPSGPYTPQRLIKFFHRFMETLQIDRAILVGNSMGAGLAMGLALDYPEQVEALVLISGFPANIQESLASPAYQKFLYHRPPLWLAKFGNRLAGRSSTEHILHAIIFRKELITPTIIERSYRNRQRGGFLAPLYSLLDNIEAWEYQYGQRLSHISQRTLLMWGDHDEVFPISVGEHLSKQLPHAQWHVIPNAGHLAQWEQPDEVNRAIRRFLDEQ
jgi:pimeloyl-ACP methyl ester carboxylesterase